MPHAWLSSGNVHPLIVAERHVLISEKKTIDNDKRRLHSNYMSNIVFSPTAIGHQNADIFKDRDNLLQLS